MPLGFNPSGEISRWLAGFLHPQLGCFSDVIHGCDASMAEGVLGIRPFFLISPSLKKHEKTARQQDNRNHTPAPQRQTVTTPSRKPKQKCDFNTTINSNNKNKKKEKAAPQIPLASLLTLPSWPDLFRRRDRGGARGRDAVYQ